MTRPRCVFKKAFVFKGEPWGHFWQYDDGEEGGELWLCDGVVKDFDGAFDLPRYVKEELEGMGYAIDW